MGRFTPAFFLLKEIDEKHKTNSGPGKENVEEWAPTNDLITEAVGPGLYHLASLRMTES